METDKVAAVYSSFQSSYKARPPNDAPGFGRRASSPQPCPQATPLVGRALRPAVLRLAGVSAVLYGLYVGCSDRTP